MVEQEIEKDCRICQHYNFNKNNEAEYFRCDRGYFDFREYVDLEKTEIMREGKLPEKNSAEPALIPCEGKDFVFEPKSTWYGILLLERRTKR